MSQPTSLSVSLETARTLALHKQGLLQRPPGASRQDLLDSIHQIGLLQLDSINVVARSHYLVMLSRVGLYDPSELDALLYPDRQVFEQWAHAACLIPTRDYPHFAPVIHARRKHPHRWLRALGKNPQRFLDAVLTEAGERGPLTSKGFEDPRGKRGSWWSWKPAKFALEILFDQGYLMVDRRINFQRYYHVAERVLSQSSPIQTVENYRRWATRCTIGYLGVATAPQVSDYYRQDKATVRAEIAKMAADGTIIPVEVESWQEVAYLDAGDLPLLEEIANGRHSPQVTAFLSPFDNLIWDRHRTQDLFGFYYRIEMYTPAARRNGYYVMPILHRGRLVGRLDPKVDRQSKTLIIHSIHLEPDETVNDDLVTGIASALREFMAFHSSQTLTIKSAEPKILKRALLNHLS